MAELVCSKDVCAIAALLTPMIGCEAVAAAVVTARSLSTTPVGVLAATATLAALALSVLVVDTVDAAWTLAGGADAVVAVARGPQALKSRPAPRRAGHRRLG